MSLVQRIDDPEVFFRNMLFFIYTLSYAAHTTSSSISLLVYCSSKTM